MFKVSIRDKKVRQLLNDIKHRSVNMTSVMTIVWAQVHEEVMQNFRRQGSYGDILSGEPSNAFIKWKALSKGTKAGRRKRGQGTKILQASGRMRLSAGTVRRITSKSAEYGSDAIQGAMMHFGGTIYPKKAKYLTIPFPGVTGRARDYENTFVRKDVIWQKQEDGGIIPLFLLKDKVKIPARPWMTIGEKRLRKIRQVVVAYVTGTK